MEFAPDSEMEGGNKEESGESIAWDLVEFPWKEEVMKKTRLNFKGTSSRDC